MLVLGKTNRYRKAPALAGACGLVAHLFREHVALAGGVGVAGLILAPAHIGAPVALFRGLFHVETLFAHGDPHAPIGAERDVIAQHPLFEHEVVEVIDAVGGVVVGALVVVQGRDVLAVKRAVTVGSGGGNVGVK
jgi:hypothetical protein